MGYSEYRNHCGEEGRANFLATIFDRSETILVIQASLASLASSRFEAHPYVLSLNNPFDSLDESVAFHEVAYKLVRVWRQVTYLVNTLYRFSIHATVRGGSDSLRLGTVYRIWSGGCDATSIPIEEVGPTIEFIAAIGGTPTV